MITCMITITITITIMTTATTMIMTTIMTTIMTMTITPMITIITKATIRTRSGNSFLRAQVFCRLRSGQSHFQRRICHLGWVEPHSAR